VEQARALLDEAVAALGARTDLATAGFTRFAESLRGRLRPRCSPMGGGVSSGPFLRGGDLRVQRRARRGRTPTRPSSTRRRSWSSRRSATTTSRL